MAGNSENLEFFVKCDNFAPFCIQTHFVYQSTRHDWVQRATPLTMIHHLITLAETEVQEKYQEQHKAWILYKSKKEEGTGKLVCDGDPLAIDTKLSDLAAAGIGTTEALPLLLVKQPMKQPKKIDSDGTFFDFFFSWLSSSPSQTSSSSPSIKEKNI